MAVAGLEEFQKLDEEKNRLEAEIKSIVEYLSEPGMPGVKEPLIDEQGFPRADLDIYAIRKARNRFACAQTDHVEVMKKIEQALVALHAGSRVSVPRAGPAGQQEQDDDTSGDATMRIQVQMPPPPFALIDEVTDGSPAQDAGLQIGDQVCRFGDIDREENGDLNSCFAAVAKLVPQSVGSPIEVVVLRGQPPAKVALQLIPRQWAGRGLLGCHLAPKAE
uniref:PDZ domain-containing protein n=1 Tax=Alexandrium catenella TaxID=2925 RepID=A0A7S1W5X9_ALECA|mmetsp:Transcript_40309/g.108962  ORF Transcript_40309/g.108962 Transcript_40309/m.108962 type:complete len:220 (+) Transcript_40309:99-758(+)